MGARSEWDFKMAVLVASIATAICLFFNVSLGPMARAQFPGLEIVDRAYPLMIEAYLPAGVGRLSGRWLGGGWVFDF